MAHRARQPLHPAQLQERLRHQLERGRAAGAAAGHVSPDRLRRQPRHSYRRSSEHQPAQIYGQSATYDPLNTPAHRQQDRVCHRVLPRLLHQLSIPPGGTQEALQPRRGLLVGLHLGKAQNWQTGAQDGGLLFWAGPVRRNYAVADFDRARNFEQTVTYELPAGTRPQVLQLRHWTVCSRRLARRGHRLRSLRSALLHYRQQLNLWNDADGQSERRIQGVA
jgi:hypothetical protein